MENPIKNIIVRNNRNNLLYSINKENYKSLNTQPGTDITVIEELEYPSDVLPCWYIDEKDKIDAIKNQKPFCESHPKTHYFKISKRLDNSFIEGYLGRNDDELTFVENFNSIYSYFRDYNNRKKVYFTFHKISLYQVMEIFPEKPLRFMLKRLDNLKSFKKNQAFMIMPFHNNELDKFYFDNIKPFLKSKFDIEIYRADDFRDNDIIVQTIYTLIEESEFIISDTTLENKNAFYELGYASAIGKEIITIQNKNEDQKLFFDRAHIRSVMYDQNDITTFQFDLESTIKSIRDRQ